MTDKTKSKLTSGFNPMEDNWVHFLLVASDRLQAIPAAIMALIFAVLSAAVYGLWSITNNSSSALIIALIFAALCFLDWLVLWLLPKKQLSYGPDRPTALVLAVLRFLLMLPMVLLSFPWWLAGIINAGISGIVFYSTWIEPFDLGVTREQLKTPKWQSGQPLRLLHIADLHVERITRREHRLNELIIKLRPDVIVFSGDFVNLSYKDDHFTEAAIRNIISSWSAPMGVYCVPGTYTVETPERVQDFVRGLDNIQLLLDEWVTLSTPCGDLQVLGMVTTHYLDVDREKVGQLMHDVPDDGFKLMLTLAPDVAPEADAAGFDLYVCGHTHGGQLRLPIIGALASGSHLGLKYVMGRYRLNHMTLYTSRGVGMEGLGAPRARFLCPPEIILWEIYGDSTSH